MDYRKQKLLRFGPEVIRIVEEYREQRCLTFNAAATILILQGAAREDVTGQIPRRPYKPIRKRGIRNA